jgi:hypothetical protein
MYTPGKHVLRDELTAVGVRLVHELAVERQERRRERYKAALADH